MANTWPRGQPRKELNSLNRWSTPLSLLVIVTLLPAVQLARSSVSSSIGEASWVVHQLHVCPWKVTSAPGLRTGEKTGKVCELHKYVRIHLLRNSRQTSGFGANAPSSLYISRGLWDRLSLSISFGTAQQEGHSRQLGPMAGVAAQGTRPRSAFHYPRMPETETCALISAASEHRPACVRTVLPRNSSRLRAQKPATKRRAAPCRSDRCKTPLFSM